MDQVRRASWARTFRKNKNFIWAIGRNNTINSTEHSFKFKSLDGRQSVSVNSGPFINHSLRPTVVYGLVEEVRPMNYKDRGHFFMLVRRKLLNSFMLENLIKFFSPLG